MLPRKPKTYKRQRSLLRYVIIIATIGYVTHLTNRESALMADNPPRELTVSRRVVDPILSSEATEEFQATAYCVTGVTKSGDWTDLGIVAADPSVIPLGSMIYLESPVMSGVYHVMDTGRLIKGKIIDIYIPSYELCREFGRRNVRIRILRYGFDG
jgi:3D (Asp-Asp-Asp) domain-containing protein